MDNVIDFYTLQRASTSTCDDEAKTALQSGVLMNLHVDDNWNRWITLFKLVEYKIDLQYINLSVIDMGTRPYSAEFRSTILEPIFDPVALGTINGTNNMIYSLSSKSGTLLLVDAISHLLPQGEEKQQ